MSVAILESLSSKQSRPIRVRRSKNALLFDNRVNVEFSDGLTTEQIISNISQLSNPQVIIWYVGCYGLRKTGVHFYRDSLISPSFAKNPSARFWLVDLTAWGAFKNPNCSIKKSHSCCDVIENFSDKSLRCIRSADIFKKLQEISDEEIVSYFNKALRRNFIRRPSKCFQKKDIKVKDIFPNICSLIEQWQYYDTSHAYSVFQYLEGCLLVDEIFTQCLTSESREMQIVFALPNDELKYYRDKKDSFRNDVQFLISERCKTLNIRNIKLNIQFFAFNYGSQVDQRPYNAPGKVLKAEDLFYSDILKNVRLHQKESNICFSSEKNALKVEIETERLLIQSYKNDDFEECVKLYGDARITQYFDHGKQRSREEVKALMKEKTKFFQNLEPFGIFSIFNKKDMTFLGQIDLLPTKEPGSVEIGFILHEKYQNQGFCSEAVKFILFEYIEEINFQRKYKGCQINKIIATAHPLNQPSKRVLQKFGMTLDRIKDRFGHPRLWYSIPTSVAITSQKIAL
jgi:[ribosomal protein S5]-alanine N-acetyltransferase